MQLLESSTAKLVVAALSIYAGTVSSLVGYIVTDHLEEFETRSEQVQQLDRQTMATQAILERIERRLDRMENKLDDLR